MSEILRPVAFDKLLGWIYNEYRKSGSVFGIKKIHGKTTGRSFCFFGERISGITGPAAGPATQLAQNIVSGYLAGARFFELKTVQFLDGEELRKCISRPCIRAVDECYNCEWSTELSVQEAYEEYVKGFILCIILGKELGISGERDFLFNMSVGYDYEGITSSKIDTFIDDMRDASGNIFFSRCREFLIDNIDRFDNVTEEDINNLDTSVSSSITLSTLHGCPPEEIEKIASWFLKEKKLHTYIKCNPTLLGYDFTRGILDRMGYRYVDFDDTHFRQDLKYPDALKLIERLMKTAAEEGLEFGVKLTNTFPVKVSNNELPAEYMYMSGRALYPLSLNAASRLSADFNGKLPVSYSGGADFFNIGKLTKTGIRPVTVATAILKPGGYERFNQLSEESESAAEEMFEGVDTDSLSSLAENVINRKRFRKEHRFVESRKTESPLPLFDCFKPPCSKGGCPVEQQIPLYLEYVSKGDYEKAFEIIAVDNALPAVTSVICNHDCQTKCTRMDYESPLRIREAKKAAVLNAQDDFIRITQAPALRTDRKAAVIGAGPAGISAAVYLRRNGVHVTVYEKTDRPMGLVESVIPEFRIPEEMIDRDFELSLKTGVEYKFFSSGDYSISELKKEYDFIIIATGARGEGVNSVVRGKELMIDSLVFLKESKDCGNTLDLGKNVAVIGGGDVAMDCVRTAKRTYGVEKADILYRRTKDLMPVSREELSLTLEDGIDVLELLLPVEYDGKNLVLEEMALVKKEGDKRPSPVSKGTSLTLEYDTVINATGARVCTKLMTDNGIKISEKGFPVLNDRFESSIENVYLSGDCTEGPATIVRAMGSSRIIAMDILAKLSLENDFKRYSLDKDEKEIYGKRGILCRDRASIEEDCLRCLDCGAVCEICTEVCPNRANIAIAVESDNFQNIHQILHIDGMCNECGNCTVFCPHEGSPYLDKPTLFWTAEDFENSKNTGFLKLPDSRFRIRDEGGDVFDTEGDSGKISDNMKSLIKAVNDNYSYLFC